MKLNNNLIILDSKRAKKDDLFPVKLIETYDCKQRYYPTQYDLSEHDFEKVMFGQKLTEVEKVLKKQISDFGDKAVEIIDRMSYFTWDIVEKLGNKEKSPKSISFHFLKL